MARYTCQRFRKTTEKHKLPGVVKFEAAAVKYLNVLLGVGTNHAEAFWGGVLPFRLGNKFGRTWFVTSERSAIEDGTWRNEIMLEMMPIIFERACQLTGISIDGGTASYLAEPGSFESKNVLENVDVLGIRPREQVPAVVRFAEAMELVEKAKSSDNLRLWMMAKEALIKTVLRTPNSPSALSHLASVSCKVGLVGEAGRRALESLSCGEDAWQSELRSREISLVKGKSASPAGTRKTSVTLSSEDQMYDEYELSPTSPKMSKEQSSSWSKEDNKNQSILSQIEHYASQGKLGDGTRGDGEYDAVYDEFYDGEYDYAGAGSETDKGGNLRGIEELETNPEDFVILHHDISLETISEYDITKVSFQGAAQYDRECTALALNTVGRCLYLLALANPSREMDFLNQSLNWFGAGAKLAGFQDENEEEKEGGEKKGAIRRSSHHLSITSRVGDGLQSALYHAECLIRRCKAEANSNMKKKKLDVEAALSIASGIKSFLNVQGHSQSSEAYERLHSSTNEVLIAAEAAIAHAVFTAGHIPYMQIYIIELQVHLHRL